MQRSVHSENKPFLKAQEIPLRPHLMKTLNVAVCGAGTAGNFEIQFAFISKST